MIRNFFFFLVNRFCIDYYVSFLIAWFGKWLHFHEHCNMLSKTYEITKFIQFATKGQCHSPHISIFLTFYINKFILFGSKKILLYKNHYRIFRKLRWRTVVMASVKDVKEYRSIMGILGAKLTEIVSPNIYFEWHTYELNEIYYMYIVIDFSCNHLIKIH